MFSKDGSVLITFQNLLESISSASPDIDIYPLLAEQLRNESGALAVTMSAYDAAKGVLRATAVSAGEDVLDTVNDVFGAQIISFEDELPPERYNRFLKTPVETTNTFADATFHIYPEDVCRAVDEKLHIASFQRLNLTVDDALIGTALIAFGKNVPPLERESATMLAHICGLLIRERNANIRKKQTENRSREILEMLPEVVFETDSNARLTYANASAFRCFGYTKYDLEAGLWVDSLVVPEERERAKQSVKKVLDSGQSQGPVEYMLLKADGTRFPALISSSAVSLGGGNRGLSGVVVDLSRARHAESHRAQLVAAVEQSAEAIMITDNIGRIQYVNPALLRITGARNEELIGKLPFALARGEDSESYGVLYRAIQRGEIWQGMIEGKRADGSEYMLDASVSPVRGESGAVINCVAAMRDVTYERELEARYQQSQKMEAIGRLAGGIAHDFNNLMTAIGGYAELIKDSLDENDERRNDLNEITGAVGRAAALTGRLLAFSRKQAVQPKPTSVAETLSGMRTMLRRLLGEDIETAVFFESDLPKVYIDPVQIEQVMMNLAVNARDAMPGGGTLSIHVKRTDSFLIIEVSDTGEGMPKEILEKIFEPFFTTKSPGDGTGLGLSTVYGIVEQNNGEITVDSTVGRGTRFIIKLPVLDTGAGEDGQSESGEANVFSQRQVIMLVEDEELVRNLTAKVLSKAGYEVMAFENPREALREFTKIDSVSLLVTDVVMPEMNGKDLADELVKLKPELKVLYMSGYTNEVISLRGIQDGSVPFIQKPFSPPALISKIEGLLS